MFDGLLPLQGEVLDLLGGLIEWLTRSDPVKARTFLIQLAQAAVDLNVKRTQLLFDQLNYLVRLEGAIHGVVIGHLSLQVEAERQPSRDGLPAG